MLKVYVDKHLAGSLFKPESEPNKYHFGYDEHCTPECAVSLSMPIANEHYTSDYKTLHPVFDMNLPEGALAERLRKEFSKVIPQFDALALLKIVGKSQIGRLRYAMPGEGVVDMPMENLSDLLAHDGAEGLFESLLSRYAVYSGISGAMPKVMVRATLNDDQLSSVTHRGARILSKHGLRNTPDWLKTNISVCVPPCTPSLRFQILSCPKAASFWSSNVSI
jgi:serine/threonine-protein kinase HipA